jgi:hypothetical protein
MVDAGRRGEAGCDPFRQRRAGLEPTRTLPPVCAVAGELAAHEIHKRLTGQSNLALHGEELTYSLLTHRVLRTEVPRAANCEFAHERWQVCELSRPYSQLSPEQLVAEADRYADWERLQLRGEVPWIQFALCGHCGQRHEIRRFARLGTPLQPCRCGSTVVASPLGMRSVVPPADLLARRSHSLAELGLSSEDAVGFWDGDRWVLFFAPRDVA